MNARRRAVYSFPVALTDVSFYHIQRGQQVSVGAILREWFSKNLEESNGPRESFREETTAINSSSNDSFFAGPIVTGSSEPVPVATVHGSVAEFSSLPIGTGHSVTTLSFMPTGTSSSVSVPIATTVSSAGPQKFEFRLLDTVQSNGKLTTTPKTRRIPTRSNLSRQNYDGKRGDGWRNYSYTPTVEAQEENVDEEGTERE